ncbi:MAG: AAA family ATPase [Chloracidobacterium sp.]|nr:AAA family ATPase [Chloracidobacterium sp.]
MLDTISALFSLSSENDNAEVARKVVRPSKELAVAGDCAVWGSHHIGKTGESDDAEEAYRGRGASAFGANVRSVITLWKEKALGEGYVRLTIGMLISQAAEVPRNRAETEGITKTSRSLHRPARASARVHPDYGR